MPEEIEICAEEKFPGLIDEDWARRVAHRLSLGLKV